MEQHPEDEEQNVYNESSREDLLEGDEISSEEEAFMKGYEDADDEPEDKEDKDGKDEEEEEE
ncbi:MAG: hypothetical protein ABIH34_06260 [Nanoarchaeota archaeon]